MGLLTGNSAMMDPDAPQAFSEELDPEEEEGEIERGTRDCLVVSNTTDHDLVIKLDDVDMVRSDRTRQKNFGVGGNIAGSANIEVGVGEAGHERLVMKASGHWVYRHTSSEIALPPPRCLGGTERRPAFCITLCSSGPSTSTQVGQRWRSAKDAVLVPAMASSYQS